MLKKQEPHAPQFFWLFAGVLLAHLFFSLRNPISKFDNKGSIRLFQSVFSASVSSKMLQVHWDRHNAAKILAEIRRIRWQGNEDWYEDNA
jgi:hypothetical protein